MNERTRRIVFWIAVAVIVLVYPLQTWRAFHNCNMINENRREGINRELVLRDFLKSAETAREQSAAHEHDKLRQVDLAAAARYRADLARIHHVRPASCTL